jgi:r-opsin
VSLLGIFGNADNISPLGSMIPAIMAKTAACVDPYLYAVTHPRFRKELEMLFCPARFESGSNFQTSYYSRGPSVRRGKRANSDCETVEIRNNNNNDNNKGGRGFRPPLNHAESSFCDESTVTLDIPVKC